MSHSEITQLRKQGKLAEAYQMGREELDNNPQDIYVKAALAWVLWAYMKGDANNDDAESMVKHLEEFIDLNVERGSEMLYDNVVYSIGLFFYRHNGDNGYGVLDNLFDSLMNMPVVKPSKMYSFLLKGVLKHKDKWPRFMEFADWWDFDNLSEEDYCPSEYNGKRGMALAEQAYIAYSKKLLLMADEAQIERFLPRLDAVVNNYPSYKYPPYYKAQMLLFLGQKENARNALIPFARQQIVQFWVWEMLGDTYDDDIVKMQMYCRGLLCRSEDKMLVSLREKAGLLFHQLGYDNEAKVEISKAITTRKENGWSIGRNLENAMASSWYKNADVRKINRDFYQENSKHANLVLFSNASTHVVLVTNVNKEKKIVNFVTLNRSQGFFRAKWMPKVNSLIGIFTEKIESGKPTNVLSYTASGDFHTDSPFFRDFSGKVKKISSGFAFADNVFIGKELASQLEDSMDVSGRAVMSYNKSKCSWGWSAVHINNI